MKKNFGPKTIIVALIIVLLFGMISNTHANVANAESPNSLPEENVVDGAVFQPPHPIVSVRGNVYDEGLIVDETGRFPLYAKIKIIGLNDDINSTIYSDPITGSYGTFLSGGNNYIFETTAMVPGYTTNTEYITAPMPDNENPSFPPPIPELIHNIYMHPDVIQCSAAGYQPFYNFLFTFEDSAEGFTSGGITSFDWGEFTSGPGAGHSGSKGIATNPSGNYNPNEYGYMLSPEIDLTSFGTANAIIEWWEWRHIEENNVWDRGSLEVTKDGGTSWQTVWGPFGGGEGSGYIKQAVILDPTYNVADFQMRFLFESDYTNQFEGWYIDDISIFNTEREYTPDPYQSNFDDDNGGFTKELESPIRIWQHGEPTTGPGSAYSAPNVWATKLDENYPDNAKGSIVSPLIDLSSYAGFTTTITFMQWYHVASPDKGILQASKDGGETWDDIWSPTENSEGTSWTPISVQLDSSYSVSDFQFRFFFESDNYITDAGWYIDNVMVRPRIPFCSQITGGIVTGYVYDANDDSPIAGAAVASDVIAVQSFDVEGDYRHAPLYWLFQPLLEEEQEVQLVASKAMYTSETAVVEVAENEVTQQDFSLEPGELAINPTALEVTMDKDGMPVSRALTISNVGPADTAFQIFEKGEQVFGGTNGIFASPPAFVIDGWGSKLVYVPNINHPSDWNTIGFWQEEISFEDADFVGGDFSTLYAIKYDENGQYLVAIDTTSSKYTFIGDIVLAEGIYIYGVTGTPDGTLYGVAIDDESNSHLIDIDIANGQATELGVLPDVGMGIDLAFNPDDGMIYMLDEQNDCLVIIDPTTLEAIDVIDLDIGVNWDYYPQKIDFEEESGVLFWVTGNLEPHGELRIIDLETGQTSLVGNFQLNSVVSSLAFPTGPTSDVPWLSENPVSGMVEPDGEATVGVRFDPSGLDVGEYHATLRVKSLTIPGIDVPVILRVVEYPKLYLPLISK